MGPCVFLPFWGLLDVGRGRARGSGREVCPLLLPRLAERHSAPDFALRRGFCSFCARGNGREVCPLLLLRFGAGRAVGAAPDFAFAIRHGFCSFCAILGAVADAAAVAAPDIAIRGFSGLRCFCGLRGFSGLRVLLALELFVLPVVGAIVEQEPLSPRNAALQPMVRWWGAVGLWLMRRRPGFCPFCAPLDIAIRHGFWDLGGGWLCGQGGSRGAPAPFHTF